jgi:hypothetical protein
MTSSRGESSSCLMSITWSLYNYLRSWSLYNLQKFSTESWSNCTKDERSHRVSTDDYDCHSADTEKMMNQKRQQSYDFKKEDKIWLNLKNIHMNCLCKKFDAKNVSTSLLRRSAHISSVWTHWVFIMCFTQSCFSQQSWTFLLSVWQTAISSQIVSNEEEFEIKKILKKRFIWHKEEFKKKYLIKWVSYTWLTWELTSVLKDTVMLNQWKLMQPEVTRS